MLDVEPDSTELALASGVKCAAWFSRYDPATSSWRTSQRSLFEGWEPYLATWPVAGMTRNGRSFRRRPLVPRTYGDGCGLLPTPTASEGGYNQSLGPNAKIRPTLETMARKNLWPTPLKRDGRTFKGAQRSPNSLGSEPLVVQVGGTLNPTWVEWLMGYPAGWTALDPLATPSSLRLSSGSAVD